MKRTKNKYLEDAIMLAHQRVRDEYEAEVVSLLIDCAEGRIDAEEAVSRLEDIKRESEKEGVYEQADTTRAP